MEKRLFGKTQMMVSVLGFGGAEIGFQGVSFDDASHMLNLALDSGINVIDTAECYVNSEELIGKAISHRRKDFYLFTKCGHKENYMTDGWTGKDVKKSIDTSLKKLNTDYLDLIQLHSCNQAILAKGDVIKALEEAKQAGKTRFIGYSGDGSDALYAINTGLFDTLQTSCNIADQECIDLTIPLAVKQNMGIIAKRPIANAAFTYKSMPDNDYHKPYYERLQTLKYSFINGNPDLSAQIALRFTLSVDGICTAIVGTTKASRFNQNIETVKLGKLDQNTFNQIRDTWHKTAAKDWVGQI